jgi:hypothetical protein
VSIYTFSVLNRCNLCGHHDCVNVHHERNTFKGVFFTLLWCKTALQHLATWCKSACSRFTVLPVLVKSRYQYTNTWPRDIGKQCFRKNVSKFSQSWFLINIVWCKEYTTYFISYICITTRWLTACLIVTMNVITKWFTRHAVTYRSKFETRTLEATLNVTGSINGSPSSGEQIFILAELYKSSISFTF